MQLRGTNLAAPRDAAAEPAPLLRYQSLVDDYMRQHALPPRWLTGLMSAYHMGWTDDKGRPYASGSGKFVRPSLCLWACEACGGKASQALAAAAALEWLHNFTLVHDDIQDGDRERRSRETVWSVWGVEQGINAGDALFALAFKTLASDRRYPERQLLAARAIAEATLEVVEGQCLDLGLEGKANTSVRTYLRMVRAKTGALLGASLEVGAILADAPPSTIKRFRLAGERLGMAFQMRDDWLGFWGDPAQTGKSATGDVRRRKPTFPIVAGYAAMAQLQRERLRELFELSTQTAEVEIRTAVKQASEGGLAHSAPRRFAQKAIAAIARCGLDKQYLDEFSEVADYVANRRR